jgi:hypothetical protein
MTDEPEKIREWAYDGRECKVVHHDLGHFCGYAKTPLRFSYGDLSDLYDSGIYNLVEVHGGVTYGVDSDGWIGFDCGHAGDVCIIDEAEKEEIEGRTVWTPEDVMEEVESLADQLSLIESFVETVNSKTKVSTDGNA